MNPAHPRSRGENLGVSMGALTVMGSSPLTRGKPDWRTRSRCWARLIPAHAGKTVSPSSISSLLWAHPRSRGENPYRASLGRCDLGSSPLTRGKRANQGGGGERCHGSSPLTRGKPNGRSRPPVHVGLIPAHAGKTGACVPLRAPFGAHPRSRGENPDCGVRVFLGEGSSPLTRGKRRY